MLIVVRRWFAVGCRRLLEALGDCIAMLRQQLACIDHVYVVLYARHLNHCWFLI
jgi:hypothetical protein